MECDHMDEIFCIYLPYLCRLTCHPSFAGVHALLPPELVAFCAEVYYIKIGKEKMREQISMVIDVTVRTLSQLSLYSLPGAISGGRSNGAGAAGSPSTGARIFFVISNIWKSSETIT